MNFDPIDFFYIAGPMTGIAEFNFPAFDQAADRLDVLGYEYISPADMDRDDGFDATVCTGFEQLTDKQRQRFARNDIGALLKVDAVVLLPGWEGSTGAQNEVRIAKMLGLPIYQFDDEIRSITLAEVPDVKWSSVAEEKMPLDTPARNARATVLLGAEELVNGDRNVQYGDPLEDFKRTAAFWNTYLGSDDGFLANRVIKPHDVAAMMALLKVSRIAWSPDKLDSWMDAAGYMACGWHCVDSTPETVVAW